MTARGEGLGEYADVDALRADARALAIGAFGQLLARGVSRDLAMAALRYALGDYRALAVLFKDDAGRGWVDE